jgi:hypothetical protein
VVTAPMVRESKEVLAEFVASPAPWKLTLGTIYCIAIYCNILQYIAIAIYWNIAISIAPRKNIAISIALRLNIALNIAFYS